LDGLHIDGWSIGVSVKTTLAAESGTFGIVQNILDAGDVMFIPIISALVTVQK
jgi:hypothetical protein